MNEPVSDKYYPRYITNTGEVVIKLEEYNRLKRLDENVNNRIKALKSLLALNSKTRSYSEEEIAEIDDRIILLESLDK